MRIVKPYAKYLPTKGLSHNEHIARCARICYASDKTTDNDQMVEGLIRKGHLSMLRHTTYYFKIDKFVFDGHFPNKLKESPYCRYVYDEFYDIIFFAMNGQTYFEYQNYLKHFDDCLVTFDDIVKHNSELARAVCRISIECVSQLSTLREFNRVSPNNIAEQSTRYCNYTGSKFDGHVNLCIPHWITSFIEEGTIITDNEKNELITGLGFLNEKLFDRVDLAEYYYLKGCYESCELYDKLISLCNIKPEDARGVLPLDIASKAAYTYFLDEWLEIINKRVYNTTGKAHPNAIRLGVQIKDIVDCVINDNDLIENII